MCLAIPGKVIERSGSSGVVAVQGNKIRANFTVTPDANVGDYVLVHAGFAITKVHPDDARTTLELFEEMSKYE